jgi:hypothetical protein
MVGDLPERGSPVAASDWLCREKRLFRRWDETVREIAARHVAGSALREVASQER